MAEVAGIAQTTPNPALELMRQLGLADNISSLSLAASRGGYISDFQQQPVVDPGLETLPNWLLAGALLAIEREFDPRLVSMANSLIARNHVTGPEGYRLAKMSISCGFSFLLAFIHRKSLAAGNGSLPFWQRARVVLRKSEDTMSPMPKELWNVPMGFPMNPIMARRIAEKERIAHWMAETQSRLRRRGSVRD